MIGLLDPALFLSRNDEEVLCDLNWITSTCRKHAIEIVRFEAYWPDLLKQFIRPLEKAFKPENRQALREVRMLAENSKRLIPPFHRSAGKSWRRGFLQLFGPQVLGDSWEERMTIAVLQAVSACRNVIIFTRRIKDRNLLVHPAGNSVLEENTCWVLHVQETQIGHRQVLCIYHPRNLTERWTTRFDWRLPAASDGAKYPFCPPDNWWKGTTPIIRTITSKPAWLDKHGNGWARPNIPRGAGYHWDVMIQSQELTEIVGLRQINVVEYGAPPNEGKPGQQHHEPKAVSGRTTGKGWTC